MRAFLCFEPSADARIAVCSQGVDLVRAEYVPDDKQDIISTVLRLKERVGENGVIFSSGGIGHSAALFPSALPAVQRIIRYLGFLKSLQVAVPMCSNLRIHGLDLELKQMRKVSSRFFAGPTHDDITYDSLASAFGEILLSETSPRWR